ncbi:MAG: hypothetical protein ACLFNR_00200 [Candidatus Paceibacterota bacterium]
MKNSQIFKYLIFLVSFIFTLFVPVFSVWASELYFSPPTGVYETGEVFEVRVMVDPTEYSINAVEGQITIPEEVEVVEILTEGSAFDIWTEPPSVPGPGESINFGAGVKGELIYGNAVPVFAMKLRSDREDVQRLRFSSASIMAPDPEGTQNVVSELTSGAYTFVPQPPEESEPEPEFVASDGAPEKPSADSETHPDPDIWYSKDTVSFEWEKPAGVDAVRTELSQKPFSIPRDESDDRDSIKYEDLLDGKWYFHLQFKNDEGWSEVFTRPVLIDTTSPEKFELEKKERSDKTDPFITIDMSAVDEMSEIEHFMFRIDDVIEERVSGTKEEFELGPIPPGTHNLIASASDRAGNRRTESLILEVEPIESPVFTEAPGILNSDSILAVRGRSLPDTKVVVSLQRRGEEPELYTTRSNDEGSFVFVYPKRPDDGIYSVKAKVVDEKGAESLYSEEATIAVQPPGVIRIGSLVLDSLSIIISILAILVLVIVAVSWGRHKWQLLRRRLDKEIREAEEEVHDTFENLRKKNDYQLSLLLEAEKVRDLTEEEQKIKEQLQEDSDGLGESVEKEVHDIKEAFDK